MRKCKRCQKEFQSISSNQEICASCSHEDQKGLGVLLTGGDWACALGDADVLAEVARTLFPCVNADLQYELGEITRLVYRDFSTASARWTQLSGHLRAHLMLASRDFGKYQA